MNEVQAIALIVAITELSKQFLTNTKFTPLVAIAVGIGAGLFMNLSIEGAIYGLILGLGTTGLYRAVDKFIIKK